MNKYYHLLSDKRDEVLQRLKKIKEEKQGSCDEPLDIDIFEHAKLLAIDLALKRIKMGSFGICVKCGDEINNRRLEALPYACTCIGCSYS